MTDIVERLAEASGTKQCASLEFGCAACGIDANLLTEAADEIEWLRKALGDILDGLHGLDPQWEKIERAGRIAKEALKSGDEGSSCRS